ncbi:hypothetical protein [Planotetraspora sp. GP83]|uniref:hypothetical protein n=1 Tax=Planotetraspora sp. GP83 TaxID=3156264 RepID=UPI00351404A9
MGVFYDYYRAASRDAAVAEPLAPRAVQEPEHPMFDAVDAKWIDPHLKLGALVALITDVPYTVDLVDSVSLCPPSEGAPKSMEEWESLPEDSPYSQGPWIEELPVLVRDALANVDDSRLPEIARQWAQDDEFRNWSPEDKDYLLTLTKELVDLARRAKSDDQMLYCWMSL